jgi:ribosomal protein S6
MKKENITKYYVAAMLKIPVKDLTDELYNLYKINLKVKRILSVKLNKPVNTI